MGEESKKKNKKTDEETINKDSAAESLLINGPNLSATSGFVFQKNDPSLVTLATNNDNTIFLRLQCRCEIGND